MRKIPITLSDATLEEVEEIVDAMKLANFSAERWVSELVVAEVAARYLRNQKLKRDIPGYRSPRAC